LQIGLYIIGDEILSGRRQDKHLSAVVDMLGKRGLLLSWVKILGDDMEMLVTNFGETIKSTDIVFSAGGIGGTPDDLTRHAVARAAGLEIERHPQAIQLLERFARRTGRTLTAERYRMIEFPQDVELIPNPVNSIPGFTLNHHHFVPGFPQMAWPMMEWVLDEKYPHITNSQYVEESLVLQGVAESRLVPLMEDLQERFEVKVFSLPRMVEKSYQTELGVKGQRDAVNHALDFMKNWLDEHGYG
jgi:molybdopterin-biosynthesis enzyme MoeA-like protein